MLQDTQVRNPITVVIGPQPEPEPQFSEEFLGMVQDHAYEVLRKYLEKSEQAGAVQLLDDIMILSMRFYGSAPLCIKNQMMSEAVGQASHHVRSLGGTWGQ